MPRKRPQLEDPNDSNEVMKFIKALAKHSNYKNLQKLVNDDPAICRTPTLQRRNANEELDVNSQSRKAAVAIHVYGQVSQQACQKCKNHEGPFAECVVLADYNDLSLGCCSNCRWKGYTRTSGKRYFCDGARYRARQTRNVKAVAASDEIIGQHLGAPALQNFEYPQHSLEGVHVLGDFYLTGLEEESQEAQEMVRQVLPGLRQLHQRDMSEIPEQISVMEDAFKAFEDAEITAWKHYGEETPPREFLVRPSGSLTSPIAHRLNQPSFTTNIASNGETADRTNPCISMVMGTAYPKDTLLYDQIHRRDHESHGYTHYPSRVRAAHFSFSQDLFETSRAKVEVVYGKKAGRAIMENPLIKKTVVPLYGKYSSVNLIIVHEESCRNAQPGFLYRKVLILAYHPQRLFYEQLSSKYLEWQEYSIATAAAMAGVHHIPGYYSRRMWIKIQPPSKLRHLETVLGRQNLSTILAAVENPKMVQEEAFTFPMPSGEGIEDEDPNWETSFVHNPHSNIKLLELLPAAIAAQNQVGEEWTDPSSFPEPVFEWWKGQKQILFYQSKVSGLQSIIPVLQKCQAYRNKYHPHEKQLESSIDMQSLREVVGQLMLIQNDLLHAGGATKLEFSDAIHDRFDGEAYPVKCSGCSTEASPIEQPSFTIYRPGFYVCRSRISCSVCQKRQRVVPRDHEQYVNTSSVYGRGEKLTKRIRAATTLIRPQEHRTEEQCQSVECICVKCHESRIDEEPRWTVGTYRPLYIERRMICTSCSTNGNGERFIPSDSKIPSIIPKVLDSLSNFYRACEETTTARIMDSWPASARP